MPAFQLAALIRQRLLSPVELVELLLRRIEALNPRLNAYLTVDGEGALASAREAEAMVMRGDDLPPLHGVPVSIKDTLRTRGLRTTAGSLVYRDYVPDEDAVVVERLRRAGAIVLGKTNTPELEQSSTTENRLGDDCRNPWNTERTSGGSSGGAASAVAAGLGPLAVGIDGGGSIRVPAAFCGVFGFKPTKGRIPSHGGFGSMPLFAQIGPITRSVRDAALMLSVTAGHDPRDPLSLRETPADYLRALDGPLGSLRVAVSADLGYGNVDPRLRQAVEDVGRVFASLGHTVEQDTPEIGSPFDFFGPIVLADEFAANGALLESQADLLLPYVRSSLEHGQRVPGYQYSLCLRAMERFRLRMAVFFDRYDLLLVPTTAVPAFTVGQRPIVVDGQKVDKLWGAFPITAPFNVTGQPAATVPCGFSEDGLPLGVQIVGRYGEEALVLRAAAAFEDVRPWAEWRPAIS
ncbi:MAG: amidase [Chloroflexota bacterium]|nr:MAG: amidase [Chloroflexota bacterium]